MKLTDCGEMLRVEVLRRAALVEQSLLHGMLLYNNKAQSPR